VEPDPVLTLKENICVCIYVKPSTQKISNYLITTFESIEFLYVKITRHISAHLEPSSGGALFKAIKYLIVIIITMDPYYNYVIKLFIKQFIK
jgi:hypothetical protein